MKTIISHFYNEEYLLPWWINHHKKFFDHGIMVNYHSTDNSVKIIKELAPSWEIINSRNLDFNAIEVDREIYDIEKSIEGWRIVLNTTEFLVGDFNSLNDNNKQDIIIPSYIMVDDLKNENTTPSDSLPLIQQRFNGFEGIGDNFKIRRGRRLGNYTIEYPLGRHFEFFNSKDFIILWYGFSPMNDYVINRKLQIQNKIPISDKIKGWGVQHITNKENLIRTFKSYQNISYDLSNKIKKYDNNNILNTQG